MSVPDPTIALIAPAPNPATAIRIMWETGTLEHYSPAAVRDRPGRAAATGNIDRASAATGNIDRASAATGNIDPCERSDGPTGQSVQTRKFECVSLARRERLALVDTMTATGPEAPTLCEGWTARDLAAHLIVRERRPDTAPGIVLSRFADHTERVRREMAKRPWPELLDLVRTGPPTLLRPLDGAINATEMFIHHEDVRRGSAGWSPREIGMADERELWTALRRMAKLSYRRSPVTVVLETPDGDHVEVKRPGDRSVVLLGRPSELLLHASGRNAVRLETNGAPGDVAVVGELQRGL